MLNFRVMGRLWFKARRIKITLSLSLCSRSSILILLLGLLQVETKIPKALALAPACVRLLTPSFP
jgi:hypothetical protein